MSKAIDLGSMPRARRNTARRSTLRGAALAIIGRVNKASRSWTVIEISTNLSNFRISEHFPETRAETFLQEDTEPWVSLGRLLIIPEARLNNFNDLDLRYKHGTLPKSIRNILNRHRGNVSDCLLYT